MPGTPFLLEVNPQLPLRLKRLHELANNLWYSWDRPTRTLFAACTRPSGAAAATARRRSSSASRNGG